MLIHHNAVLEKKPVGTALYIAFSQTMFSFNLSIIPRRYLPSLHAAVALGEGKNISGNVYDLGLTLNLGEKNATGIAPS